MTNKSLQAGCLLYHCLFFLYIVNITLVTEIKYIYIYITVLCPHSVVSAEFFYHIRNKHSDACNYLPPYKLDVLKIV